MTLSPSILHSLGRPLRRWLVALAALAAAGTLAAAADPDANQILAAELPEGATLRSATPEQVHVATRRAVQRRPRQTLPLVRAAILGRMPRRIPTEGKNVVDYSKETVCPPCEYVLGVVRAAIRANPDEASAIIGEASNLCPGCADTLLALLDEPGLALGEPEDFPGTVLGFGFGLGPGFPSAPPILGGTNNGGVLSLPPVGNPVTAVNNL